LFWARSGLAALTLLSLPPGGVHAYQTLVHPPDKVQLFNEKHLPTFIIQGR